jgi:hypothetical protein
MIENRLMELLKERGYQAALTPRTHVNQPDWNICYNDRHGIAVVIFANSPIEEQKWMDDDVIQVEVIAPPLVRSVDGMIFQEWMDKVDEHFHAHYGMSHNDFEDYNWFDEFDNEVSPDDSFEEWRCMNESNVLGG